MKHGQLAINSISTRGGFEETLNAYAAAGFRNVEFYLGHVKEYLKGGHSPADVRRLLEAHGQRCIGGFEGVVETFSDEPSRRKNHAAVAENARLLSELGGKVLVVGTDGANLNAVDDAAGRIAETFAAVAAQIEGTGVQLALEFNWGAVKSLPLAAEIARRSGAANVGVLFDPAHYHCTPTKFEDLTADNVRFIKHVHVDDMNGKPPELSNCNSDRALPGQGTLDLRAIYGRLEEHGYGGYFSIEMFSDELWNLPVREAAQQMYQSLLRLCDD
ncbi:MAG: sugar phosphate isomerase/epimerase [Armatimonadota bacterium]|nr:sugar phosphate isomerase/epimerase [Armatimonadota bacterium]